MWYICCDVVVYGMIGEEMMLCDTMTCNECDVIARYEIRWDEIEEKKRKEIRYDNVTVLSSQF